MGCVLVDTVIGPNCITAVTVIHCKLIQFQMLRKITICLKDFVSILLSSLSPINPNPTPIRNHVRFSPQSQGFSVNAGYVVLLPQCPLPFPQVNSKQLIVLDRAAKTYDAAAERLASYWLTSLT